MSQGEPRLRNVGQIEPSGGYSSTAGCWGGTAATEPDRFEDVPAVDFDDLLELDWRNGAESAPARIAQLAQSRRGGFETALRTAPAEWDVPQRAKTIIRGKSLNKRYVMSADNYVDAVKDATVEIKQGEMVAVMGPSGSGKSTLVHILSCLDSANSGEIWLDGRRVDNLGRRDLARLRRTEVGFIFQTFNLVPSFTALENVMLAAEYAGKGRREARGAAQAALSQVGLADRMDHRPTELSGGQQQRVAIARALVNGPKVIFGDEPTGNLDSTSSTEIVQMMHEINEQTGTTFVLVTHDPNVASTCDRVFHMLDGRVTNGNGTKPHAVSDDEGHVA